MRGTALDRLSPPIYSTLLLFLTAAAKEGKAATDARKDDFSWSEVMDANAQTLLLTEVYLFLHSVGVSKLLLIVYSPFLWLCFFVVCVFGSACIFPRNPSFPYISVK